MSETLMREIVEQLKNEKYRLVNETLKRLSSLDLEEGQVDAYLNWAYQNALDESGQLDDKQYFLNLNQLPLIDQSPKSIKSVSIEEALRMLNDILVQQQSSLSEVVVEYWYARLFLDDGYEANLRIMSKVRPIELAEVLALREGVENLDDIEIVLETNGASVILNQVQAEETLLDLIEEKDILRIYFREEGVKIELHFSELNSQTFHAIESVVNE